ncbi:pyruvate:ferredoxin (flavodoxin) oxidoreductase [Ruminococcaceae bacterium OttesenSCG-928-A16]|nr:pyruvate:ferredoxin (flavodoxin) oxidoreductase [Ruminococcaceae bacterium OttesenSCG-928-A16]
MARIKKTMDGNTAAAHASYAFTEVAAIYPITPSSPMAEITDTWSADGLKNIFGDEVSVVELQSEGGAAGAVHGSLNAGALTTTYTASQGLLLMVPNMYKIAGELLPCVINVSARTLASHALSIFGDHSDIYACRQTGFAMLAESNPQEVMDLTPVAHLATLKSRVPFVNFFDGFRTSHELQKIETWDFKDLEEMADQQDIADFRKRALNPERPVMRGSHQNGDIFFQNREASNKYYTAVPGIVEHYMGEVNKKLGTDYGLFNYYGAPDADRIIIAMGSFCDVSEEVIDYLTAAGEKVGIVKVRLYRPFSAEHLIKAIPASVKKIAVMDRTKEPGALGEPLYMDVLTALAGKTDATIVGGRYGLSSKDTPPSSVFAVYENLEADQPKNGFTVGIVDDVTHLSLPERHDCADTTPAGTISCKFWGLGGDGTVGANKNSIKIIGDHTDKYVQAYFQYDSKKTGGVTVSHLRFGDKPIKAPYYVKKADFVACHNPSYIIKGFKMVRDVKPGGKFLINAQWTPEELDQHMPAEAKRYIADNNIEVYLVNAIDIAREIGMGKRTNTILQSAFFKLANIMSTEDAVKFMKDAAYKSYSSKGEAIVNANYAAIDAGVDALVKVDIPASWKTAAGEVAKEKIEGPEKLVKMVTEIMEPVNLNDGDSLPVSAFVNHADGTFEQGASAFEKRGVAVDVPEWDPTKCIQCNQCSYVCPHATIRPFVLDEKDMASAPKTIETAQMKGKDMDAYQFVQAVSPLDCMGCGVCAQVCPAPGKALVMKPLESQLVKQDTFDYCVANVDKKPGMMAETTVKGSQFNQPLLEFSGSCAGCAETAYARLVTQLYGERMYISNATGCSSIWGGPAATSPYTVNRKSGHGPTWANSLFEDNAENGFGMYLGQKAIRNRLKRKAKELIAVDYTTPALKEAAQNWLDTFDDGQANLAATDAFVKELEDGLDMTGTEWEKDWIANGRKCTCDACKPAADILAEKEYLSKKSVWIFGGDGWAYDIGYGGLDHVLASGENVNVFVFDTEVYSNTGGQASKASQIGQVAQFAAAGKNIGKKSLAEMAMAYGYVYVAQIAMGADQNQTIKAITEAESYPGPSLIIGYAPCEMHGIKGGMVNCQSEMKKAVQAGYWNNFRFDPRKKAAGQNPFTLDSKEPTGDYLEFINNETRYTSLKLKFPDRAETLFGEAVDMSKERYNYLQRLAKLYDVE